MVRAWITEDFQGILYALWSKYIRLDNEKYNLQRVSKLTPIIITHVNYQVKNSYYMLELITEANFLFVCI